MNISNCIDSVERRGNVFYLRWRVPAKFRSVEHRAEINQSLKTQDPVEARGLAVLKKKALQNVWRAKLLNKDSGPSFEAFSASVVLLEELQLPYIPIEGLLSGPLEELVSRIEKLADVPEDSPAIPAAMGVCNVPHIRILEMPEVIETRLQHKVSTKNADQLRQWRNRYKHAARIFSEVVSNKHVHEITEDDARRYYEHWQDRVNSGGISDDQAIKRVRYLRQMIDEYHKLAGTLPSRIFSPMAGFKIEVMPKKNKSSNQGGKPTLPKSWVKHCVQGKLTSGIKTDERIDAGIVIAETGCRQTEIIHIPPQDIILDHPIPHLRIRYVEEDEHVRDIKNRASIRLVPLLGAAFDAMRRNPKGFSRYRSKGSFSEDINNFLRQNNLFPTRPEGHKAFTFGGVRHTYEERGVGARMSNEERAFLLGHSVGKLRGRSVYGDGPELKLRALYAELLAHPTDTWQPRPKEEIWQLIEAELEDENIGES